MDPEVRAQPVSDLGVDELGGLGEVLGRGGHATVYELPAFTLPRSPGPLVCKWYRPGREPQAHAVRDLIARREALADADRVRLDSIASWPLRVVLEGSAVRGVVLPRIPDPFMQRMVLPSGRVVRQPRDVQHLFVPAERNVRVGMPVASTRERLEICRDFAAALAFLHGPAMDLVYGDINARNALFRLDAAPRVLFLDCDATRIRGRVAGMQPNTPDWEPPERNAALSRRTDRYKLGLFVLRCLTPGQGCSIRTDPTDGSGVLDAEGLALLHRAVAGPPDDRPPADVWSGYLNRLLGEAPDRPAADRCPRLTPLGPLPPLAGAVEPPRLDDPPLRLPAADLLAPMSVPRRLPAPPPLVPSMTIARLPPVPRAS